VKIYKFLRGVLCRHFDLFFLGVKILLTSSVGGVWILNGMALGEGELVLRNIPTEIICESTLSSPVVKSLWENIVLESGIEESSSTQKLYAWKTL
jgi:hypothetical protein